MKMEKIRTICTRCGSDQVCGCITDGRRARREYDVTDNNCRICEDAIDTEAEALIEFFRMRGTNPIIAEGACIDALVTIVMNGTGLDQCEADQLIAEYFQNIVEEDKEFLDEAEEETTS